MTNLIVQNCYGFFLVFLSLVNYLLEDKPKTTILAMFLILFSTWYGVVPVPMCVSRTVSCQFCVSVEFACSATRLGRILPHSIHQIFDINYRTSWSHGPNLFLSLLPCSNSKLTLAGVEFPHFRSQNHF